MCQIRDQQYLVGAVADGHCVGAAADGISLQPQPAALH